MDADEEELLLLLLGWWLSRKAWQSAGRGGRGRTLCIEVIMFCGSKGRELELEQQIALKQRVIGS
jgi:hypothetical protein